MTSATPQIGLIVVGDEILTGRRRDRHLEAVIARLQARGLELSWARYIGDDRARLAQLLTTTLATPGLVLCCGGIGATPDDVTRAAAADGSGRPLERHPEGVALLEQRFRHELTENRLRMVDFPAGAMLIPNPINGVPGFQIAWHCFVPGFPEMAWPMIEWSLDHRFADWRPGGNTSRSVRVRARESDLVALLERLGAAYPQVRFSSLPERVQGGGFAVELGVRGPPAAVEPAFRALDAELAAAAIARLEP